MNNPQLLQMDGNGTESTVVKGGTGLELNPMDTFLFNTC